MPRTKKKNNLSAYAVFAVFFIVIMTLVILVGRLGASLNPEFYVFVPPPAPKLDKLAYDLKLYELAHVASSTLIISTSTKSVEFASTTAAGEHRKIPLWPVRTTYPNYGALLPFNRIIAYYGNFLSTQMGILGEFPEEQVIAKLNSELAAWRAADPLTPVIPAIDYIAVTAQSSPIDGTYRARMSDSQVEKAIAMAKKVNGIVILDIQVAKSTLEAELPELEKYLKLPQVHLAIDPEFSMKTGAKPGTVVGTMDAADINYSAEYLAGLVKENHLPPKILIVHRFTYPMVTNYKNIKPLPQVQIVMNMDGWGPPDLKKTTYNQVEYGEPVQFTGFKIFYKNDLWGKSPGLMTPSEILKLTPAPSFIMYQ